VKPPAHKTLPDVESKRAEKTKCFLSFLSARVIARVTPNNCRNEIFRGKCDLAEFQIPFAWYFLLMLAGTCANGQPSWRVCWAFRHASNPKTPALPVTPLLLYQQPVLQPLCHTLRLRANNRSAPASAACSLFLPTSSNCGVFGRKGRNAGQDPAAHACCRHADQPSVPASRAVNRQQAQPHPIRERRGLRSRRCWSEVFGREAWCSPGGDPGSGSRERCLPLSKAGTSLPVPLSVTTGYQLLSFR